MARVEVSRGREDGPCVEVMLALDLEDGVEPTGYRRALEVGLLGSGLLTVARLAVGGLVWHWPKVNEQWASERAMATEMRCR